MKIFVFRDSRNQERVEMVWRKRSQHKAQNGNKKSYVHFRSLSRALDRAPRINVTQTIKSIYKYVSRSLRREETGPARGLVYVLVSIRKTIRKTNRSDNATISGLFVYLPAVTLDVHLYPVILRLRRFLSGTYERIYIAHAVPTLFFLIVFLPSPAHFSFSPPSCPFW